MRNIAMKIRFVGTAYHGFQRQDNAHTVQAELENTLFRITGENINVIGCSRTDTGVHAREYVFNFHSVSTIPCQKLILAIDSCLPRDIGAFECFEVPEEFHARYHTKGKEYVYMVLNSHMRDPFLEGRILRYPTEKIDAQFLNLQAQSFVGTHDFTSFCSLGSSIQDKVRTVERFSVVRSGEEVIFTVKADGYLYNMVRIMVGTLLGISQGRIPPDTISDIISSKNRKRAGVTAPAWGLYLTHVYY